MAEVKAEKIVQLVAKKVREAFNESMENLHTTVKREVENAWKNHEKLAQFLTNLEAREKKLFAELETLIKTNQQLTKTIKELVEAIGKKARVNYAT